MHLRKIRKVGSTPPLPQVNKRLVKKVMNLARQKEPSMRLTQAHVKRVIAESRVHPINRSPGIYAEIALIGPTLKKYRPKRKEK